MSKKIGEDYKPVFMDSVTEKFIQGPYLGNGRDPEIPYVRYLLDPIPSSSILKLCNTPM